MKTSKVLIKRNPVYYKCPSCAAVNSLKKSRSRTFIEKVIKALTFFKIYRCHKCGWRGYRSTFTLTFRSVLNFFFYIFLGIAAGYFVLYFLKVYVT